MSNLTDHARRELEIAGLFESDVYGTMIGDAVMELIEAFDKQDHSGASAHYVLTAFAEVAAFRTLSPLTNNPDEWMEFAEGKWQSRRNPGAFSNDGGKTYTLNEEFTFDDNTGKAIVGPTHHSKDYAA